ncbi:uncharacterized protein LOC134775092 [Penaeus indicus]|uniref:uncharacterized protein LOC134775092 n=1 Tax=Penaeus indicus TaxID=29960 RepID=UPI00300C4048
MEIQGGFQSFLKNAPAHSQDSRDVVKILSLGDSEGMLLLDVYLGEKCITALFNTGAEVSLVHSDVLKELSMPYKQDVKVESSNKRSVASMATVGLKGRWRTKTGKTTGAPVKFSRLGEVDLNYATDDLEISLIEGIVTPIPSSDGATRWFRIPFKNDGKRVVEVGQNTSVGALMKLVDISPGEARRQVVASVKSNRNKTCRLLEEVDKIFERGSEEHRVLIDLVLEFPRVFSLEEDPLPISNEYFHEIKALGPPVYKKPYPILLKYRDEIKAQIDSMLRDGIIQPSRSPYNAPLVPVRKRDGGLRLCLHFRALNECIEDDRYPLPNIDSILQRLGKSRFFSCLDLRQGYHQIPLTPASREKTAFSTMEATTNL